VAGGGRFEQENMHATWIANLMLASLGA